MAYRRAMSGENDLGALLASMSPHRRPGSFVFVVSDGHPDPGVEVLASIAEDEGLSIVTTQEDADRAGLSYDFRAGWITLEVHSALAAVGLTAAVSSALADSGISCNVIAGYHHDHLLIPHDRVTDALEILTRLSTAHRGG